MCQGRRRRYRQSGHGWTIFLAEYNSGNTTFPNFTSFNVQVITEYVSLSIFHVIQGIKAVTFHMKT